jgi:hypothetical protein
LLATIVCGNCVPQTRHQRRGARPPRLCRPQAALFVKKAARVHCILPRVRYVRETPLVPGQDEHCMEVIWGRWKPKYFCKRALTDRQITSVFQNMICPSDQKCRSLARCHVALNLARVFPNLGRVLIKALYPLYPQKRTSAGEYGISVLCQERSTSLYGSARRWSALGH